MPVPQQNSLFVEQGILPVADRKPVPQQNSLFVEQASCLLLTENPIYNPKFPKIQCQNT
jgi:hypothetical protein